MVISRSQMARQLEPGLGSKGKKKSNPIAKKLSDRRSKAKVVQSKKVYNRKKLIRETNFKGVL